MAAQLRVVQGGKGGEPSPADSPAVWPLFAELARRHDISREECIVYGVIVAISRTGTSVTAKAVRSALAKSPIQRNRMGGDCRHTRRRLSALVAAGLLQRRTIAGAESVYIPLGPR